MNGRTEIKKITDQGMLKVICPLPVQSLLGFRFELMPDCHAHADIRVLLEVVSDTENTDESRQKNKIADLLNDVHGETVRIEISAGDGSSLYPPVFAGMISSCRITWEAGIMTANILALSGSCLLDAVKKSRSFQDTGMSYEELAEEILRNTPRSGMLYAAEYHKLGKPVIQYEETDFEFLLRMASHLGTCLYPDISEPLPRVVVGLPEGEDRGRIGADFYRAGLTKTRSGVGKAADGARRRGHCYFDVRSGEALNIGDTVIFKERLLRVCAKRGSLDKGLLYYTYTLSDAHWVWRERRYNPLLQGTSLTGTVLERQQESVRLHLDIDDAKDSTFYFPWKPETGNIMYCMPETGTKVHLHIGGRDEGDAVAVDAIRQNGVSCPETREPDKRYLTDETGKMMKLHPELLSFGSGRRQKKELLLQLEDSNGILFRSSGEITVRAEGAVQILGKTVTVSAPEELIVLKRDLLSPTMLDLCGSINMLGKTGKVASSKGHTALPESGDGSEPVYETEDIMEKILASIPLGEPDPQEASEQDDIEDITAVLAGSFRYKSHRRK